MRQGQRQPRASINFDQNKMKIVYMITERDGRSFWTRIGVAFVNSDGSMNVKLNAYPVDGRLHIRDYVPRDHTSIRSDENNDVNYELFDDIPF